MMMFLEVNFKETIRFAICFLKTFASLVACDWLKLMVLY